MIRRISAQAGVKEQNEPRPAQRVSIHGVSCFVKSAPGEHAVTRIDTGAEIARAPTKFLAIARAATLLHTPENAAC